MENNVPTKTKHSRRHSTGNLYLEITGYQDVLSRYLSGPVPSCHDNCKHSGFDHLTELPKSTSPGTQRSNKNNVVVHGIKKNITPIPIPVPKSQTKHSLPKYQVKPLPIEPKRQDLKLKSKSKIKSKHEETDPFYIPPSRITRRFSDVGIRIIPTNANGLEGVPLPNTFDVGCLTKKIDPRKASKSAKTRVIPTSTKPRIDHDGSTKSKPADPDGITINQELENGQNLINLEVDNDNGSSQNNTSGSGVKKAENPTCVGNLAKEKEHLSSKNIKFRRGKILDTQSESNTPRKLTFGEGKVLDENQNCQKDGKSLRRLSSNGVGVLPTPESKSVDVVLKPCDTEASKGHLRLNNVIEETASKLIKTRKSKVKALVGAFEMISAMD